MARPVTLFTGQWADLSLEELAAKMAEIGYEGLELACWGDHMDLDKAAYEELNYYLRNFDPEHLNKDQIFTRLGYIDVQNLATRIKAKTSMALGLMDQICPPSTQFAAYNKITAPKSMILYPDYGHEGLPGLSDDIFQYMTGL